MKHGQSYSPPNKPFHTPPTEPFVDLTEALTDDSKLSEAVRKLLSLDKNRAEPLIGDTTGTSFRKIHEHVTAVLDRAMEILSTPSKRDAGRGEIVVGLTKGLILVKYQLSRKQISPELASILEAVLNSLINSIGKDESAKMFQRARTLLDAYAVLIYQYHYKR
ncbi:MAG: hypothetical protein QXH45_07250 [Thermosphaera sp.]